MHPSATQKLQFELRSRRERGEATTLPPRTRWREGVLLWAEIVYCSPAEAQQLRDGAERLHVLSEQPPAIGLVITPEFDEHGRRLAMDVDQHGYGGLVRFENLLTEDNYLQVMVGEGLYPLIVREEELMHFWMQLTLQCERHFLAVASEKVCFGYWESDLALSRAVEEA
ncbi:hypothetical protein [Gloeobacter violaceus]|uniref:Gll1289 protein n=1 Tax=Gloeobacter violaceus (strain ATCC 29082 / PCC 7421) TaxID=251221 RepID=Q7NL37_GLOVI|nr:hypothetical protein [Gloeobacter violaceus]BAC89230.1 gll1289 [Gloeobacter violaceus PCC 7421]